MDHGALSEFVSNLIRQPEMQHVRVVRTNVVRMCENKLVNFFSTWSFLLTEYSTDASVSREC
jgi:hypothetical protein